MNKPFLEIGAENFSINAFEIKPLEGYEKPINEETKKELPFCCEFHEGVHKNITDHYNRFPNCCEWHKPLNDVDWFNKEDFKYIIDKVVNQVSYTEHCIRECINDVDWYNAITEYIDFNISSFGQLRGGYGSPVGLSVFTFQLKHYITNTDLDISKSKRKALINFFEVNEQKETDKTNKTDLNVLYVTYQKWLKVFPFDISFFANLKEHFENQLPILNGKPEVNRYSKIAKVRLHTKDSLIDVLLQITNNIITQINTSKLFEKGLLTEPNKIKLELIVSERKQKLKEGYVNNSHNEETRYRKILKEWIKDEKEFINEITPFVKDLPPQPIRTKADIFKETLQEGGFYNLEKVKKLTQEGQSQLIELICKNMAYGIAMFDYLGFCTFLDNEKGVKYKANYYLSKLFNEKAKDGTQAKHYRNSLLNNKPRYTSYLHKEKVIKDYEKLK